MMTEKTKQYIIWSVLFACGMVFALILNSAVINLQAKNTDEIVIQNKIAVVNQDVPYYDQDISFGVEVVNMLKQPQDYELVQTTYSDAQSGVEGQKYAGYILIDSKFTNSIYSIDDEIPTKAKMSYQINSNLDTEEQIYVKNIILSEMYIINNNINYMYICSILQAMHDSQKNVSEVLENEESMKSIIEEINKYNNKFYESSEEYLNNLDENEEVGNSNINLEFSLPQVKVEDTGIINIQINEEQLKAFLQKISDDYTSNITTLVNNVRTEIEQKTEEILTKNFDLTQLTADEEYLSFLNEQLIYSNDVNNKLIALKSKIDKIGSYNLEYYQIIFDFIEELKTNIENEDIVELQKQLTTEKIVNIKQVIIDFKNDYYYWEVHPNAVCNEKAPNYDNKACMIPFKAKYKESDIVDNYAQTKANYEEAVNYINSQEYTDNINKLNTYLETLNTDYNNYVSNVPFESAASAVSKTEEYCQKNIANNVTDYACKWSSIYTDLKSQSTIINQEYKEELLITLSEQEINVLQSIANREEQFIKNFQTDTNLFVKSINTLIDGAIDEEKLAEYKTTINENFNIAQTNLNENLNKTIDEKRESLTTNKIENQKESQTEINQKTAILKEEIPKITATFTENETNLESFNTLFENSKNGEDENYYLYDFVSTPININKVDEANKLTQVKDEVGLEKILIVAFLLFLLIGLSVGMYYLNRKEVHDEEIDSDDVIDNIYKF